MCTQKEEVGRPNPATNHSGSSQHKFIGGIGLCYESMSDQDKFTRGIRLCGKRKLQILGKTS